MEILYWAPNNENEDVVYQALVKTYNKIHTYNDIHFYGEAYEPVDKVVQFNNGQEQKNILDDI